MHFISRWKKNQGGLTTTPHVTNMTLLDQNHVKKWNVKRTWRRHFFIPWRILNDRYYNNVANYMMRRTSCLKPQLREEEHRTTYEMSLVKEESKQKLDHLRELRRQEQIKEKQAEMVCGLIPRLEAVKYIVSSPEIVCRYNYIIIMNMLLKAWRGRSFKYKKDERREGKGDTASWGTVWKRGWAGKNME